MSLETFIQIAVASGPIVLGLMGAILSIRPPTGRWGHRLWFLSFVVVGLVSAVATFAELRSTDTGQRSILSGIDRILDGKSGKVPADVTATFVYPEGPAIVLYNTSETTALTVLYQVVLWNLDSPEAILKSALEIPVAKADYVRHDAAAGPFNLFERPLSQNRLKAGDRIFGYASVSCPDCKTHRQYWINAVWKTGGWYAPLKDGTSVDLLALLDQVPLIAKNLDGFISGIPETDRRKIMSKEEWRDNSYLPPK